MIEESESDGFLVIDKLPRTARASDERKTTPEADGEKPCCIQPAWQSEESLVSQGPGIPERGKTSKP